MILYYNIYYLKNKTKLAFTLSCAMVVLNGKVRAKRLKKIFLTLRGNYL